VYKQIFLNFTPYLTKIVEVLFENTLFEIITSPAMMFPQFLMLLYFTFIFISFYFTYFNNYTNEENLVDIDYLISSSTIEAEKEITAFDDILLGTVILLYIFGWYFYIHC
jgi:ABC-type multidrug transport system fused ATPase/permease subunit